MQENASMIVRCAIELVYKRIAQQLSDYIGKVFEEIYMQYLRTMLLNCKAPMEFISLGRR